MTLWCQNVFSSSSQWGTPCLWLCVALPGQWACGVRERVKPVLLDISGNSWTPIVLHASVCGCVELHLSRALFLFPRPRQGYISYSVTVWGAFHIQDRSYSTTVHRMYHKVGVMDHNMATSFLKLSAQNTFSFTL